MPSQYNSCGTTPFVFLGEPAGAYYVSLPATHAGIPPLLGAAPPDPFPTGPYIEEGDVGGQVVVTESRSAAELTKHYTVNFNSWWKSAHIVTGLVAGDSTKLASTDASVTWEKLHDCPLGGMPSGVLSGGVLSKILGASKATRVLGPRMPR